MIHLEKDILKKKKNINSTFVVVFQCEFKKAFEPEHLNPLFTTLFNVSMR